MAIQAVTPQSAIFSPYDADNLQSEMDLFELWFIQQLLGISLDDREAQMLKQLYTRT